MGWNMDFGYKEGERYKIVNPELNDHNKEKHKEFAKPMIIYLQKK